MNSTDKTPIVLIHGLWMTPKSWNTWAERFRAQGHEVIIPGWPGIDDRSVEDIRRDPSALKGIGLEEIADNYERIIRALPVKPIIMGHSFGGVLTQMLADRGLGAAYVGVAPGQTAGVTALPLSTLWTGTPILSNPFGINGAKPLSKRHFHFTFGNDLSRRASDALWEEYAVNSYNRVFFEGVTSVLNEKGGVTHVDYARADRAPLLVITGEIDHVVPPAIGRAIVKKYRSSGSPAIVDYKEYAGRTHRLVSQDGWEEIADYALTWAVAHATASVA
ncbi:alpha/beta hydrolase [Microbacterium hydrocarbonoxydans]|uniref:Pimeloyl-ACP methyl ester carboxylesterase n=1 Tax=Microbacterium hydrocarbonoxydans TaxID=273678 RepID=A0A1H4J2S8_9MICO|nr:alpha/beta fold hydrolase [Microbacterium hydrocarbonoxydans]SEB40266.1 Pimeloyl-ACP methyl ester carboxylesterase [Microbacterium hydrocarbonoxydans]